MAISVADNFSYQGGKPLDARMKYDSVANMVNVPAANLYDGCFAYVTAEQKYYSYDSANDTDPTLGKWREYSGGGSGSSGHTIEGDGTAVTDRDTLNFKDMSVSDDSQNEKTDVKPHRLTAEELADIISPLPFFDFSNPGAEAFIFSTNERVIGQWIDGKPLYQKTVDCGALPNATYKSVAHNISNLDKVVSFSGVAIGATGNAFQLGYATHFINNANANIRCVVKPTVVEIATEIDYSTASGHVTIRYTKTSDSAVSTGEKIVGQWVDGKALYQKTVDYGSTLSVSNTTWTSIGVSTSGIDNIISCNGMHTDGRCAPLMATIDQSNIMVLVGRHNGEIDLRYFTIRYTKA